MDFNDILRLIELGILLIAFYNQSLVKSGLFIDLKQRKVQVFLGLHGWIKGIEFAMSGFNY